MHILIQYQTSIRIHCQHSKMFVKTFNGRAFSVSIRASQSLLAFNKYSPHGYFMFTVKEQYIIFRQSPSSTMFFTNKATKLAEKLLVPTRSCSILSNFTIQRCSTEFILTSCTSMKIVV